MKNKRGSVFVWILVILILLIIGVGGIFGYSYLGKPRVIEEQIEGTNFNYCSDSDGNDIYTKGQSKYSTSGPENAGGMGDICDYYNEKTSSRVGLVGEGVCEGKTFKITKFWRWTVG